MRAEEAGGRVEPGRAGAVGAGRPCTKPGKQVGAAQRRAAEAGRCPWTNVAGSVSQLCPQCQGDLSLLPAGCARLWAATTGCRV